MNHEKILLQHSKLPDLPMGLTSFGATLCKNAIFVWGGHCGAAHEYYAKGQNRWLLKLDFELKAGWQQIHESMLGRQGLALVSYQDHIYRIGGFEARNTQEEEQDLHSVANFEMFDWDSETWHSLHCMPEPRSSFDAVVIGDQLFVVGGWSLAGAKDANWLSDAICIDLSNPNATWLKLPQPPFHRRAISTATQDGKLYVIGGMQKEGGPTKQVSVFDPETKLWSSGPPIPGDEEMEGFGTSSFNIGGHICLSTYSGKLYRLDSSGDQWNEIGELEFPRFFHQLIPITHREFAVVGGANMQHGKTRAIELLKLSLN